MSWKLVKKGSGVYKRKRPNGRAAYRVRPMSGSVQRSKVFEAKSDADAIRKSKRIIADLIETPNKPKPKDLVAWEDLVQELLPVYEKKRKATYVSFEYTTRLHLIPFLNENARFVTSENPEVLWLKYKAEKKHLKLLNHHKHFSRLCGYAYQKGLLDRKPKLEWDRSKEDKREPGQVITEDEFRRMIDAADATWRDRIILGWYTGMRPGEVRCLQKSRVDFGGGIIRLTEDDTKTHMAREFVVPREAMEVLRRLKVASDSMFFFPSKGDGSKPMSTNHRRWAALLRRAGIDRNITPHDLRHTYVTRQLQRPELPPLVLCFAVGMSLEEMQKTYMHMTAEDTRVLIG